MSVLKFWFSGVKLGEAWNSFRKSANSRIGMDRRVLLIQKVGRVFLDGLRRA